MRRRTMITVLLCVTSLGTPAADWTYNMAFTQWAGSNDADRYYTNTPEAAEERAAAIAAGGYDAVILSGYHFRLNWLGRDEDVREIVRMIVDACHRHGLKVIEHIDLTIGYYDSYPIAWEHPDWLMVHAGDMLTRHRIFCFNNPEFQRFYLDYVERWQRETGLDAWQMDEISWLNRGYCGCRWCRAKWEAEKGRPYPAIEVPSFFDVGMADPEYREWMRFRGKSIDDFYQLVGNALRAINPDVKLFDYTTALQSSPGSWGRTAPYEVQVGGVDTIGTELNQVPFQSYPYVSGLLAQRRALGEYAEHPTWAKFDITVPSAYFCWAFGRTLGHSIWWSLAPDNENPRPQDLLEWEWQMDDATARVAADVGLLLSGSTRDLNSDYDYFDTEFQGWMQVLLLEPFAARPIIEDELTQPGALDGYRLIVLPNTTAISGEQKAALMAWVGAGGHLLLTYEAGTLDHDGAPSADPLLAEAGVTLLEVPLDPSALPAQWAEAPIRNVRAETGTRVVESIPGTGSPLLTVRTVGEGEIWYFAARAAKLALEPSQLPGKYAGGGGYKPPLFPDMIDALQTVTSEALGEQPYFAVEGVEQQGLLAWIYRAERDGRSARVIHLLNCTGRDLQAGDTIAFDADNPPPTPPLPELTLRVPGDVTEAVFATPEREGSQTLAVTAGEGASAVTVPAEAFSTYGVIWVYE